MTFTRTIQCNLKKKSMQPYFRKAKTMKMKKLITFLAIIAITMSITVNSLAAQNTNYSYNNVSHRFDSSPIMKNSGNWAKTYDDNTSITFQNSSLEQYQKSTVITYVSGEVRSASSEKTVSSGQPPVKSVISSTYTGNTYLYLRIRNPYYQTSSASPMTTSGYFEGYLG